MPSYAFAEAAGMEPNNFYPTPITALGHGLGPWLHTTKGGKPRDATEAFKSNICAIMREVLQMLPQQPAVFRAWALYRQPIEDKVARYARRKYQSTDSTNPLGAVRRQVMQAFLAAADPATPLHHRAYTTPMQAASVFALAGVPFPYETPERAGMFTELLQWHRDRYLKSLEKALKWVSL